MTNSSLFNLWSCLAVWGQACKTYLNKILILQKRTLRFLYFADWHDHAIPLFLEANVLPYYESVSALMLDINNDKAPENMSNIFPKKCLIFTHTIHDRLRLESSVLKILD